MPGIHCSFRCPPCPSKPLAGSLQVTQLNSLVELLSPPTGPLGRQRALSRRCREREATPEKRGGRQLLTLPATSHQDPSLGPYSDTQTGLQAKSDGLYFLKGPCRAAAPRFPPHSQLSTPPASAPSGQQRDRGRRAWACPALSPKVPTAPRRAGLGTWPLGPTLLTPKYTRPVSPPPRTSCVCCRRFKVLAGQGKDEENSRCARLWPALWGNVWGHGGHLPGDRLLGRCAQKGL